jgi:hypothetical protein
MTASDNQDLDRELRIGCADRVQFISNETFATLARSGSISPGSGEVGCLVDKKGRA